jgi:Undecaprenyl-phosphate galactose phosphotransferase WbaP
VQDTLGTEEAHSAVEGVSSATRTSLFLRRWVEPRRRLLVVSALVFSDILLALVAWQVALVFRDAFGRYTLSEISIASVAPNIVVWIALRAVLGLYPGYGLDQVEELRRQTFALLASLAIIVVFAFASKLDNSLGRLFLFTWCLGLLLAAPVARSLVKRALMSAGWWGKAVMVLGPQDAGAKILNLLRKEWQLGFKPIGTFVDRAVPAGGGVPYQVALTDAVAMAREYGVDTAVFAMPDTRREHLVKLVNLASTSFRYVIVLPDLAGVTNSAVIARNFAGNFAVEIKYNLLSPWARRVKRGLDLLLTVVGGLLISPLLIAVAILIKLESSGPAFYGHRRIGEGGRHFRCWKFRTMHTNAEELLDGFLQSHPNLRAEWEQNFKLRDDPRVTAIGRFLRKTSLDELPQLWNVLRGDMSLVGPRPIVDAEVSKYGTVYEMYRRIRPGISGFWQVSGRSDTNYAERVMLDAYYVNNWSVWLDIVILIRTVRIVVLGRGAY